MILSNYAIEPTNKGKFTVITPECPEDAAAIQPVEYFPKVFMRKISYPHSASSIQETHKNNLFGLKTYGFCQVWFSPIW
jgi:hypothetical protein